MAERKSIEQAVEAGVSWLLTNQKADGSFGGWGLGSTSLAAMALLHGSQTNAAVHSAIGPAISYILATSAQEDAFFRALSVMALVTNGEKTAAALDRVLADCHWLTHAQAKHPGDPKTYGGWGNRRCRQPANTVNTMLALLALAAATRWGIIVPDEVWRCALKWYQQGFTSGGYGNPGFDPSAPSSAGTVYGTTAAALAGLGVIGLFISDMESAARIDTLLAATLDWLTAESCRQPPPPDAWLYFAFYALIRAEPLVTGGLENIGDDSPFPHIGAYLLDSRRTDGSWATDPLTGADAEVCTSFALLCLNKAQWVPAVRSPAVPGLAPSPGGRHKPVAPSARRHSRSRLPPSAEAPVDVARLPLLHPALLRQLTTGQFAADTKNLIIVGYPGSGKTRLAASLGFQARRGGFSVKFCPSEKLLKSLCLPPFYGRRKKSVARLAHIDLLIIDDWLKQPSSWTGGGPVCQLLEARCDRACTIIASCVDPDYWFQYWPEPPEAIGLLSRFIARSYIIRLN